MSGKREWWRLVPILPELGPGYVYRKLPKVTIPPELAAFGGYFRGGGVVHYIWGVGTFVEQKSYVGSTKLFLRNESRIC